MKLANGRETTASIKDLAPASEQLISEEQKANNEEVRNASVVNDSNQFILQLCPPKKITRQQSTVPDPYVIVDLPLDLVMTINVVL